MYGVIRLQDIKMNTEHVHSQRNSDQQQGEKVFNLKIKKQEPAGL